MKWWTPLKQGIWILCEVSEGERGYVGMMGCPREGAQSASIGSKLQKRRGGKLVALCVQAQPIPLPTAIWSQSLGVVSYLSPRL